MSCKAEFKIYDEGGKWLAGNTMHLPDQLDWMPIEVKAHWFLFMGNGPSAAKYVLLMSQGEQRLIADITLNPLDYQAHKERLEKSYDEIERYLDENKISRQPRNQ